MAALAATSIVNPLLQWGLRARVCVWVCKHVMLCAGSAPPQWLVCAACGGTDGSGWRIVRRSLRKPATSAGEDGSGPRAEKPCRPVPFSRRALLIQLQERCVGVKRLFARIRYERLAGRQLCHFVKPVVKQLVPNDVYTQALEVAAIGPGARINAPDSPS